MGQLLVPQDLRKRHPHPVRLLVIENMPGCRIVAEPFLCAIPSDNLAVL